MSEHNPVIFALDVDNQSLAHDYAHKLKDDVGLFKVGLELFCSEGPQLFDNAAAAWALPFSRESVFLDLKLHDIPETVKRATKAVSKIPEVKFISVHASGGSKMLEAACEAAPGKILAVTILTSMGPSDLTEVGIIGEALNRLVLRLTRIAYDTGCAGVICAPSDVLSLRKLIGDMQEVEKITTSRRRDFVFVTPGIRPAGLDTYDQKRVTTPEQAILNGADYIVVGRPIRDAQDPAHAARIIANEAILARARRNKG